MMTLDFCDRYSVVNDETDTKIIERAVFNPKPDRAMIARAEEAAAWLGLVNDRDRIVVRLAIDYLADGWATVPWSRMKRRLAKLDVSPDALYRRYHRSLAVIVKAVNRARAA